MSYMRLNLQEIMRRNRRIISDSVLNDAFSQNNIPFITDNQFIENSIYISNIIDYLNYEYEIGNKLIQFYIKRRIEEAKCELLENKYKYRVKFINEQNKKVPFISLNYPKIEEQLYGYFQRKRR